jgi:S-adenosylmethionine:tRNA ribosyltransferase-isomerase
MQKSDFNYQLPPQLIAQYPLANRTASRLLCMNKHNGQLKDCQFHDFVDLLRPNDLLVFNNTRVIPARLYGNKSSGGKVEILIERILDQHHAIAHLKASKPPRAGTRILFDQDHYCEVLGREQDLFKLVFADEEVLEVLQRVGHIPLPPYIHRADDAVDLSRYQTVFAQQAGAVAAPTAGLHFDTEILQRIQAQGIQSVFITLHVGSGTFRPVRVDNLAEHRMHSEYFSVSAESVRAIQQTRAAGGRVIAIGTTVARALESAVDHGELRVGSGETHLFITPGYRFQVIDALLTNFHLPESTLLILVCAFAGYSATMAAYQHAIQQAYRFFSYGDAMFLSDN